MEKNIMSSDEVQQLMIKFATLNEHQSSQDENISEIKEDLKEVRKKFEKIEGKIVKIIIAIMLIAGATSGGVAGIIEILF